MKPTKKNMALVIAVTALALVPGASVRNNAQANEPPAEQAPPPAMPVEVAVIQPETVQIWQNFSGHVVAVNRAEIRPQVSGIITEIHFEDGAYVEKDQTLIVIDPRPYKATLEQAEAALKAAKTTADLAEKEYQRARKLIETEAISQSVMDERVNKRLAAAAAVSGAEAFVSSAKINLDYAYIKAPISGKTSRAEITIGNLVQSGPAAPLLTSIISDDKVYAEFEVDETTYLHSVKNAGTLKTGLHIPVRIVLPNTDLEYDGYVQSFDNRIDPTSGTIRARALFDNKDKYLLPGMSVTVLMGEAGEEKRILVSERAIGTDQDRKFVYIINADGLTEYREVKVGDSVNGNRVIRSGLKQGDTIITEGLVRIRPGMPVAPKVDTAAGAEEMPDQGMDH